MDFGNVRFTVEHEWVRFDGENAVVGVTDFAAGELGDIVYVELPGAGTVVKAGEVMGTIEAVKTVADLYAPVSGTILEVNAELENAPETVNSSPFEDGWFVKMKMSDLAELESLMEHDVYQELTGN